MVIEVEPKCFLLTILLVGLRCIAGDHPYDDGASVDLETHKTIQYAGHFNHTVLELLAQRYTHSILSLIDFVEELESFSNVPCLHAFPFRFLNTCDVDAAVLESVS